MIEHDEARIVFEEISYAGEALKNLDFPCFT
jgi:hypothetical protein